MNIFSPSENEVTSSEDDFEVGFGLIKSISKITYLSI